MVSGPSPPRKQCIIKDVKGIISINSPQYSFTGEEAVKNSAKAVNANAAVNSNDEEYNIEKVSGNLRINSPMTSCTTENGETIMQRTNLNNYSNEPSNEDTTRERKPLRGPLTVMNELTVGTGSANHTQDKMAPRGADADKLSSAISSLESRISEIDLKLANIQKNQNQASSEQNPNRSGTNHPSNANNLSQASSEQVSNRHDVSSPINASNLFQPYPSIESLFIDLLIVGGRAIWTWTRFGWLKKWFSKEDGN